jgi:hypothetical protein
MYLGDGYVARMTRTHRLRIFLNRRQGDVIARVEKAIKAVMPSSHVGQVQRRTSAVTEVTCYSAHWPAVLPQHGPGRKHTRRIELEPWQMDIVRAFPVSFLRGLVESDGCRHRRIVKGRNYPAYSFTNHSEDILRLFTWACDLVPLRWRRSSVHRISIARRPDLRHLDALFDVATLNSPAPDHAPTAIPSSATSTSTPGA